MTVTTGYRWKLETAQAAAESFMVRWANTCEQTMIAGSIRRQKRGGVSEIEFLAQPIFDEVQAPAVAAQLTLFGGVTGGQQASTQRVSRLDERLEGLAAQGILFKDRPNVNQKGLWGAKHKQFWIKARHGNGKIGYIKVDFFICTPPAEWGSLSVIRTGPASFSELLMVYINDKTNLQQQDGRLIVRATGVTVPTPTEESYFKVIGLPYVEPHNRTADWAQKWIRMRRDPVRYQPPSSTALSGNGYQIGEGTTGKAGPDQPQPGEQSTAPSWYDALLTPQLLTIEEAAVGQPHAGEQSAPPVIGEPAPPVALSTRVKVELARLPGAHPTVLISRLKCEPSAFRAAIWALKDFGDVHENHSGGLWLTEDAPVAVDEADLPGRPPDGELDEANETVEFVKGPPIYWHKSTWGVDLSRPRGYGARLRIMPKTRVANVKSLPAGWQTDPAYTDHVYIGRAHHGKQLSGSPLGNPFMIGPDGTRDQVIDKYRAWIAEQPHLLQMIPYLAAHAGALVCWCAPEACHGDVIVEYIERYRRGEWSPPSRKGALGYNDSEARAAIRQRLLRDNYHYFGED